MPSRIINLADKIIIFCFYLLLFITPLIFIPVNYELFEFNKMITVYFITTIIMGAWSAKIIAAKKINFTRTPFDVPLLIFLAVYLISTLFSIDSYTSIFGYYSRFNGGLISIICYILLYFSFVANFPREKIPALLKTIIITAILVSLYGILEKLGIDKDLWVQDVQNRVFSTLGQPNWLAAYLAVLLPLTLGIVLQYFITSNCITDEKSQNSSASWRIKTSRFSGIHDAVFAHPPVGGSQTASGQIHNLNSKINWVIGLLGYWVIIIFYLTLLFTKSRSGFLGFWTVNILYWFILFFTNKINKKTIVKLFLILNSSFLILNFFFATPFQQLNKFTLSEITKPKQENKENIAETSGSSIIDIGITESAVIRNIVWKGAFDIAKHYPLFGTGPETFAYAYYQFRPKEHNLTSEWDFLYNKAHNEYLNYAATTGIFGLGSYLFIIASFILWNIKKLKTFLNYGRCQTEPSIARDKQMLRTKSTTQNAKLLRFNILDSDLRFEFLHLSLFSAWLSILVTNFFGFSVVLIQLFFFLIPGFSFVISQQTAFNPSTPSGVEGLRVNKPQTTFKDKLTTLQKILFILLLFTICYLLFAILRYWYADILFASGYHQSRSQNVAESYLSFKKAIRVNSTVPLYFDEFSLPAAQLAVSLTQQGDSTQSAALQNEAVSASNYAVSVSPSNVNFWKNRTRVFFTLTQIDESAINETISSLETAKILSPTDPKILYNLALMYDQISEQQKAIELLNETILLKVDYRDAYYALGLFYQQANNEEKAKEMYNFILTRLNPTDTDAQERLKELK